MGEQLQCLTPGAGGEGSEEPCGFFGGRGPDADFRAAPLL
mgnify:CR=1 FL=1